MRAPVAWLPARASDHGSNDRHGTRSSIMVRATRRIQEMTSIYGDQADERLARGSGVRVSPLWPEVNAWRRARRTDLMGARLRLPRDERHRLSCAIADRLRIALGSERGHVVGAYWAIRGEPDLRGVLAELVSQGTPVALPAVVAKGRPLEFWGWNPEAKMSRGIWNIPVPVEQNPVRPSLLLVPLVGFDVRGYRLGYGGGYYDRTLGALKPRPLTIGVRSCSQPVTSSTTTRWC